MARLFDAISTQEVDSIPKDALRVDDGAASAYLIGPAFFDPQVNGFAGVDFQNPDLSLEEFEFAARELQRYGCGHFLPTLITAETSFLLQQFQRMAEFIERSDLLRDMVLGFHLEGPFLSSEAGYIGAHPKELTRSPEWSLFESWQSATGGRIRLITLAAELPGAIEFIQKVVNTGVTVSLGHTNPSLDEMDRAYRAGARMITHLSNGCPPQMHRHDNIIQRALSRPGYWVSLIPDGFHIPHPSLGNMVDGLGWGRVVMTTDAMSAAGAPPGRYSIGSLQLEVGEDRVVRLPGTRQFAGSSLTPLEGFYHCVRFGGLSADRAWRAWTHLRSAMFPKCEPKPLAVPWR